MALCDDVPPVDENGVSDLNARPVWGLNTLLGTCRLDLLIAKQLGCTTMIYLAKQDLDATQNAGKDLADTILAACGQAPAYGGTVQACKDKNGEPINILQNAINAYEENSRRLGKGQMVAGSMKVSVGKLTGAAETNIPVPEPFSMAEISDDSTMTNQRGQKVYKAYVPVSTNFGGVDTPITFAAITDEPRLVDTSKFTTLGGTMDIPAIANVEVDERVTQIAPGASGQNETATVHVAACAQAGGPRGTQPTGLLAIGFPQGIPPVAGTPVDLSTPVTIMNASKLAGTASGGTMAPVAGWNYPNNLSKGGWYEMQGGPFGPTFRATTPGAGRPVKTSFNGRASVGVDNGSTSLAFMVYDWLRSCGLRPRIDAVVQALNQPIRNQQRGTASTWTAHGFSFTPPAYAAADNGTDTVAGAITLVVADHDSDSRSMNNYEQEPNAYADQLGTAVGNTAQGTIIDTDPNMAHPQVTTYNLTDGTSQAIGGAPLQVLLDFDDLLASQQPLWQKALESAGEVITEADRLDGEAAVLEAQVKADQHTLAGLGTPKDNDPQNVQDQRAALEADIEAKSGQAQGGRAKANTYRKDATAVKENATQISITCETLWGLRKDAAKLNPEYAGGGAANGLSLFNKSVTFIPMTQAPTKDDIMAGGALPTGQPNPGQISASADWKSPKDATGVFTCRITSRNTQLGLVHQRPDGGGFFQPALAQSTTPTGTLFVFAVQGDASRSEANLKGLGGKIKRVVTYASQQGNAFANHNLLEGQFAFNNPGAMVTQVPGNTSIEWSVEALDWNSIGDTYVDRYGVVRKAAYSANVNSRGYNVSPRGWCHQAAFAGGDAGVEAGDQPCFYISAVWNLNSPMAKVPTCSDGKKPKWRVVENAQGQAVLEVDPCPPPPRRSH